MSGRIVCFLLSNKYFIKSLVGSKYIGTFISTDHYDGEWHAPNDEGRRKLDQLVAVERFPFGHRMAQADVKHSQNHQEDVRRQLGSEQAISRQNH